MSITCSRRMFLAATIVGTSAVSPPRSVWGAEAEGPVASWRDGVKISPVSNVAARHTMHTYYLLNPESPDGRWVLFFASADPAGHVGQICLLDRQTGEETVLADEV